MTSSASYHRKIGPPQYPARPQAPARLPQLSSQIPLKGWASKDRYNITGEPQIFFYTILRINGVVKYNKIKTVLPLKVGRDCSVSTATHYELDGPGIRSQWGGAYIFRTCSDWPWGPPSLLHSRYQFFPKGKAAGTWNWPPTPTTPPVGLRGLF
jgi:hypothetical protein